MASLSPPGPYRLLLQFVRAEASDDPYAFRFGPQDYILPTSGGESPRAHFDFSPSLLSDLAAVRLPGRDPLVVQRLGETLRRFLLPAGFAEQESAIAAALAADRPVVVTIRSSAAEIYALPWELLALKSGQLLGELPTLLLRFEWPECPASEESPLPRPEGGRMLFAWSAAGGGVPADLHLAALVGAAERGYHPFDSTSDVLPRASLNRIGAVLRAAESAGRPIAVLHLLCHGCTIGSGFGLALDGDGDMAPADARSLRAALRPFARSLRLIVLSACDSGNGGPIGSQLGSVAQTLHRAGFGTVIASRYPLSVAGSVWFTEHFYRELLEGPQSVEQSFLIARQALAAYESEQPLDARPLDWASLQMYARHDDGDDTRPIIFRPYRGLLAFQPEHSRFFFMRQAEVQELLSDLANLVEQGLPRFLVVAGASGTGKSSLVLAGAVPKLHTQTKGLRFVRLRPGSHPEQALNDALAQVTALPPASVLLFVDQLEELFTLCEQPSVRSAFAARLWQLASPPSGMRVIVTLRIDFLGRCGELVLDEGGRRLDQVAYDEAHRVFVAQVRSEELREAIVEPARKVGLTLAPGLADRMLGDVAGEPGAQPLLEDALDVLWQRRLGRELTQDAYDSLGGVVGALHGRAEALLSALSLGDLAIARRLLSALVAVADDTAQDTRMRVPLAELLSAYSGDEATVCQRLLKELVAARLLVQSGESGRAEVEVAHEALIRRWPRLRSWLNEDRVLLVLHRRIQTAALAWQAQGREEALLLRGGPLAQAVELRKSWEARLSPLEREFLNAGESLRQRLQTEEEERWQAARKRVRNTRITAAVLALLLLLSIGAGVEAYRLWQSANDGLLVSAALAHSDDPTTAALLLREAGEHRGQWRQVAVRTLQQPIARRVTQPPVDCLQALAVSLDGDWALCTQHQRAPALFATDDKTRSVQLSDDSVSALSAVLGRDAKLWALGLPDGSVLLFERALPDKFRRVQLGRTPITRLALNRDEATLLAVDQDGSSWVMPWNNAAPPRRLSESLGTVEAAALSDDGKLAALGLGGMTMATKVLRTDGSGELLETSVRAVRAVAFDPSASRLFIGEYDPIVYGIGLADTKRQAEAEVEFSGASGETKVLAVSPDGQWLLSATADGQARVYSIGAGQPTAVLGGLGQPLRAVWSGDSQGVMVASADGSVRHFPTVIAREPRQLSFVAQGATALFHDGPRLLAASAVQTSCIDLARGAQTSPCFPSLPGCVPLAFSSDGRRLALGCKSGAVELVEPLPGGHSQRFTGHLANVKAVAFSADGSRLFSAAEDRRVLLHHVGGGEPSTVSQLTVGEVVGLASSRDGHNLLLRSSRQMVELHDADNHVLKFLLSRELAQAGAVAADGIGGRWVVASADGTVELLSATMQPVARWEGVVELPSVAVVSPDGTMLAVGGGDGRIALLPLVGNWSKVVLGRHAANVTALAFSPDSQQLVSASGDGAVQLWTVGERSLSEALWQATSTCLPAVRRKELLLESASAAARHTAACQVEVARRGVGPEPSTRLR